MGSSFALGAQDIARCLEEISVNRLTAAEALKGVLEDRLDLAPERLHLRVTQVTAGTLTVDQDIAGRGLNEPGNHARYGGFARTRLADDAQDLRLAAFEGEADFVHGGDLGRADQAANTIDFADVANLQKVLRHAFFHSFSPVGTSNSTGARTMQAAKRPGSTSINGGSISRQRSVTR